MKHPISTLPYEMNSVLETGTDLNDYRTAGIFFFSYANRPTNLPPDGYGNGWCLVLPSSINSENYCTQIWISFGNNATTDTRNKPMARRTYFNGTWTDWWKLPCTGEYTSSTDVTNAITTALADYIPHNTTEITATTEAEFEQMMEALPQSPPKIHFFHVLQGTSTRIGLPSGRYGIEVYSMGSILRSVMAYSYNNDQKTFKKIRTAGASGTWSSWLDITNTDTVSNLQTQVGTNTSDIATLQTQVGTNTTNISTLQTQTSTLQTNVNTNTSNITALQTGLQTANNDITTLQTSTNNRKMSHRYNMTTAQSTIDMVLDPDHSNPNIYPSQIEIRMVNGIIVVKFGFRFSSGASLNAGESAEVGKIKSNLLPDYNLGFIRGSLVPSFFTPTRFLCECDISSGGTITVFNGTTNNWGDNQALMCSFMYLCPTMRDLSTFENYFESNPNVEIYD